MILFDPFKHGIPPPIHHSSTTQIPALRLDSPLQRCRLDHEGRTGRLLRLSQCSLPSAFPASQEMPSRFEFVEQTKVIISDMFKHPAAAIQDCSWIQVSLLAWLCIPPDLDWVTPYIDLQAMIPVSYLSTLLL